MKAIGRKEGYKKQGRLQERRLLEGRKARLQDGRKECYSKERRLGYRMEGKTTRLHEGSKARLQEGRKLAIGRKEG